MSLSKICTGLFDGEMATMQRSSTDIVIYCPGLGLPVRVVCMSLQSPKMPVFQLIFLSGYLGASGEQIQQLSVFESTLTLDKYMEKPQSAEQQLLAKLAAGGSISEADAQDLFVGCNQGGAVFLKGYGKGHCADNDNGLTVLKATPEGRAPR
ncbi:hypothetical protein B0H14DRAFT_2604458 [Mycena olivaceomarginata]|nr:hypothetical protein B0H14DRAFT_2604458 [Mycena olivaceomarginata]